jgi:UDP-N-acetylglucosamine/UDP-N-acetylgalactosamine diphosphorylase
MSTVPPDVRQRLEENDQGHVLADWDRLDDAQRRELLAQIESVDIAGLRASWQKRDDPAPAPGTIEPAPVVAHDDPRLANCRPLGEASLSRGEVAVLLVAGGQGSRLGFEHPKGMYPVGPVTRKPLFQIHAEKVLALSRRYGKPIPLLVMTSRATHDETVAFFEEHAYFGLPREDVSFFEQGTMPALDLATGRLLLEAPGRLFLSPDGHGGTLTALAKSGLLDKLARRGIREVFYLQVDNPLVRIADPEFLGLHIDAGAEVSSRAIAKNGPKEKMGVLASVGGRCTIVEYSDLSDELAHAVDASGRLRLWAGSPAIHLFSVEFLQRMTGDPGKIPLHLARKKVPHVGEAEPKAENALKFERFIFDVLPAADRWAVVESLRADEFAPLKNATGADSPATSEAALSEQAAAWVIAAGGKVPRPLPALEVSPLYALDAAEFRAKFDPKTKIEGPTYWG